MMDVCWIDVCWIDLHKRKQDSHKSDDIDKFISACMKPCDTYSIANDCFTREQSA